MIIFLTQIEISINIPYSNSGKNSLQNDMRHLRVHSEQMWGSGGGKVVRQRLLYLVKYKVHLQYIYSILMANFIYYMGTASIMMNFGRIHFIVSL
jgi:hypothetical protein